VANIPCFFCERWQPQNISNVTNTATDKEEFMGGALTNQQRSKEFYRIAYECAKKEYYGSCTGTCATCTLNIHLYVDDIKDATLIKTSVAVDFLREVENNRQREISDRWEIAGAILSCLFALGFIFVVFVWPIMAIRSCVSRHTEVPAVEKPTQDIPRTLQAAYYVRDNPRDMDRDGLIDCVDRAILFREYYGSDAQIIWNKNDTTKMNHVFIRINSTCIEPGVWHPDPIRRTMKSVWSTKYDGRYDRNITAHEPEIKRGIFVWLW